MSKRTMKGTLGLLAALTAAGACAATTEKWTGGNQSSVASSMEVPENWDGGEAVAKGSDAYDFVIDQDGAYATFSTADPSYSISGAMTIGSAENPDVTVKFTGTRNAKVDGVNGPHNSNPAQFSVGGDFTILGTKTKVIINKGLRLMFGWTWNGNTKRGVIGNGVTLEGEGLISFGESARTVPALDYDDLWLMLGQQSAETPYTLAGDITVGGRMVVHQGGSSGINGRSVLDLAGHTATVNDLHLGTVDNDTGKEGDQSSFGAIVFSGGTLKVKGSLVFDGNPDGTYYVRNGNNEYTFYDITCDHYFYAKGGGTLECAGSLNFKSRSSEDWNVNELTLVMNGDGSSVQEIEALQADVGDTALCLLDGYAFGTLRVKSGANVKLVDNYNNDRTASGGEVFYMRNLVVESGATLDLNGIKLYVLNAPTIEGTVLKGTVTRLEKAGELSATTTVLGTNNFPIDRNGHWVGPMVAGDADGDGHPELYLITDDEVGTNMLFHCLRYSNGAISELNDNFPIDANNTTLLGGYKLLANTQPVQVMFADAGDGSGNKVLFSTSGSSDIRALAPNGASASVVESSASYGSALFILADIDCDGVKDIVTASRASRNDPNVKVWSMKNKSILWSKTVEAHNSIVTRIGVADLDGDRKPEVMAITRTPDSSEHSAYGFYIWKNDGGVWTSPGGNSIENVKLDFGRGEGAGMIAACDVTGDGKPYIFIVDTYFKNEYNDSTKSNYGNLCVINLECSTLAKIYLNGNPCGAIDTTVQFFDADGDGVYEFLYGGKIYNGSFEVVDELPIPASCRYYTSTVAPALADMNGDQIPEIVYVCSTSDPSGYRYGRKVVAYDPKAKATLPGFPLDLFVSQDMTGAGNWYAGEFAHWLMSTPIVADFDGDGKWEIAVGVGVAKEKNTNLSQRAELNIFKVPYSVSPAYGRTEKDIGAWQYGRTPGMEFMFPLPKKPGLVISLR